MLSKDEIIYPNEKYITTTLFAIGQVHLKVSSILPKNTGEKGRLTRWWTVESLGNICKLEGFDELIQALRDEDRIIRGWATEAIRNIRASESLYVIKRTLEDLDGDSSVKTEEVLRKIDIANNTQILLCVLREKDTFIKWLAATALAKKGGSKNIDALIDAVGFKPSTCLKDGIQKFVDWYKVYHGYN